MNGEKKKIKRVNKSNSRRIDSLNGIFICVQLINVVVVVSDEKLRFNVFMGRAKIGRKKFGRTINA